MSNVLTQADTYDNTQGLPWLVPALQALGFEEHDRQSMARIGNTADGQAMLYVRWFYGGIIILSHEQEQPTHWHQGYRGQVWNQEHLLSLMDGIGWLPELVTPPTPAMLTVEQLLNWPKGIGGITDEEFLAVRTLLLASGWDGLTREQQLIYQLGQEKILGELYAATHAEQKKMIRHLNQQLQVAVDELNEQAGTAA